MSANSRNSQSGAALIEFAFVLLPLLLLTFGTLLYGLVFVTQQAMAFAAQRGADAIVQVDPNAFDSVAALCSSDAAARVAENRISSVLPDVGLLNYSAGVNEETGAGAECSDASKDVCLKAGNNGCTVSIVSKFGLQIPLLPLPDAVRGVGFVPIEVSGGLGNDQT